MHWMKLKKQFTEGAVVSDFQGFWDLGVRNEEENTLCTIFFFFLGGFLPFFSFNLLTSVSVKKN